MTVTSAAKQHSAPNKGGHCYTAARTAVLTVLERGTGTAVPGPRPPRSSTAPRPLQEHAAGRRS